MTTRVRTLLAAMLGLVPLLPACFIESTGGPPWSLDGLPLPNDENSIQRTIHRMSTVSKKYDLSFLPGDREPPSLFALRPLGLDVYRVDADGHLGVGRESSEWGDEWTVAGVPVPIHAHGGLPGDAALEFLRDFAARARAGGGRVEDQDLEPDVDVVWVATEMAGTHGLVWGAPASPWVFEAAAERRADLVNLVRAFAEAARASNRDQAFSRAAGLAGSTLLVTSDTTLRDDHQGSVEVEADDVTLDCTGHSISGPGTRAEDEFGFIGILLDGRTGVTVKNCRVSGFDYGMLLTARLGSGSDGNRLIDNAVFGNRLDGIRVTESDDNVVTGNIASSNGQHGFASVGNSNILMRNQAFDNALTGFAIGVGHQDNAFYENISSRNGSQGFAIVGTGHMFVRNLATDNGEVGFGVNGLGSRSITLKGNIASSNRGGGFFIDGNSISVRQNRAVRNGGSGLAISGNTVSVKQNRAVRNEDHGLWIAGDSVSVRQNHAVRNGVDGYTTDRRFRHDAFYGNTASRNRAHGFLILGAQHTFVRNTATENGLVGFAVDGRFGNGGNIFERNVATANAIHGFQVANCRGNTLIRNTASKNGAVGFTLDVRAHRNTLYGNIAKDNRETGFRTTQGSTQNTFERNVAIYNGWIGFHAESGPNLFSSNRGCRNGDADALDVGSTSRWRNNAFCSVRNVKAQPPGES